MNKLIRKMQTAAGGGLVYNNDGKNIDRANYDNWSKLSFADKMKRRFNIAKHLFNESSSPIINSVGAIFGEYDPENPDLNTGEPSILPSRGINPKTVLNVAKGVRTLEDYLKATKVSAPKLEGTSLLRNSYADDRFIGGTIFRNSLPDEAMQVLGHGMAKSATILDALARLRYILDNGIDKTKNFYTLPLKLPKGVTNLGDAGGTGGGVPYFDGHFLITGSPGLRINSVNDIRTIYINDAYENKEALKAALKLQQYLLLSYPKINFKLYSLGFKQGGKMNILEFLKNGSGIHIKEKNKGLFTKYCNGKVTSECIARGKRSSDPAVRKRATFADNARHFKHKEGGLIKALEGTKLGKILNSDTTKFFINTAGQVINGILQQSLINKLNRLNQNKYDTGYEAIISDIGDVTPEVNERLTLLKELNPNQNFGDIDIQRITQLVINERRSKNRNKAELWKLLEMQKDALAINALQGTSGYGDLLAQSLGIVGNYLNNKTSSSNSSSSYSTSNFWKKPSLSTNVQGSIPDFSYMLNPSYKV